MLFGKCSIFLALFILFAVFQEPALAVKKSYIVYLGGHSHGPEVTAADLRRVTDSHNQLLASFLGSEEKAKDAIIYNYKRHINGFAALLEEEEAAEIAKHPHVVSVFPNQAKKLHTTHSWDFLMLERQGVIHKLSAWKKARFGEDTIIANLDTGVWPESKSFSGEGYGPIPSKWKGICQFDDKAGPLCNRKLIGARYFNKGFQAYSGKLNSSYNTPRDTDGHGSHTLSTAAGNFVPGASVFGVGNGTAKGGSPRARVAAYKVCWPPINGSECFDADIVKAFDTAIHDGVDVLSVSLGGAAVPYSMDGLAIAAFHAVKKGVVVVASAGNSGPFPGSVSNVAPWIITVGASTIDRQFEANVQLKNGSMLQGTSLSAPLPNQKLYPLISAEHARAGNVSAFDAILCLNNTLDSKKAKGKIVVCLRGENARVEKGHEAYRAGAAGMILCNDAESGNEIIADPHILPATHINFTDGRIVFDYLKTARNPQGLITTPKAEYGIKPAPFMASFSSRGPNMVTPEILKPDVTAPGVNIIAAYSEAVSPTGAFDVRKTPFNTESGTSMSCPHVSGVAGLIKTRHPDWSPAAIRSAIMTTGTETLTRISDTRIRDNTVNSMRDADYQAATPFAYGSGHIRPNRALDPGLVYDLTVNDYLDFLCGIGYSQRQISQVAGIHYHKCPENYSMLNFNNPSITVLNVRGTVNVTRTVKLVGKPGIYASRVRAPFGYSLAVEPRLLQFEKTGEEKSFQLSITVKRATTVYGFGELVWSDSTHYVRSPIVLSAADP
ncbi:UNVERIFIED_CONTAM: Subtilisin-like protease SBT5.4 [Sesamum indicum]